MDDSHMLRSATVQSHHIIEAWYSTTWTYETLMFFRSSCLALLNEGLPSTLSQFGALVEVLRYLDHWAHTAVPSRDTDVIEQWLLVAASSKNVYTILSCCSFHRKQDRIALLNYFMTGELGPHCFVDDDASQPERVASLAMFSVPLGAPSPEKKHAGMC